MYHHHCHYFMKIHLVNNDDVFVFYAFFFFFLLDFFFGSGLRNLFLLYSFLFLSFLFPLFLSQRFILTTVATLYKGSVSVPFPTWPKGIISSPRLWSWEVTYDFDIADNNGPDINQFKTFFNNVCSENELLSF